MNWLPVPVAVLVCLILSATLTRAQDIRLAGSDLLVEVLENSIARYSEATDTKVELDLIGTLPAMSNMREGKADLAIIAIPIDHALPEQDYTLTPFAYSVTYVLVNEANPIGELSLDQLSGIYVANAANRIQRWSGAGLTGNLSTRTVVPMVLNVPDSINTEMFKYIALDSRSLKSDITYLDSIRELCELIVADAGAIGVAGLPPVLDDVRAIAVSSGESGSFAFGPTAENVYYGDYLLRLPFYIALPKGSAIEADALIRELMSSETANELAQAGLMPLPENVRKRAIQDLDR